MPAYRHPTSTSAEEVIVVELNCDHRGSSHSCYSKDSDAVIAPAKVLSPFLFPWIEEWNQIACDRIETMRLDAFVSIAQWACQPKI